MNAVIKPAPAAAIAPRFPALPLGGLAGTSFKHEHLAAILAEGAQRGFFEVHAENYMGAGGPPHRALEAIRRDHPFSLHGVCMSIGGERPLDLAHLKRFKHLELVEGDETTFVKIVIQSNRADSNVITSRVREPLAIIQSDNVVFAITGIDTTYVAFRESTMSETDFIRAIARRTGCGLLLDINNVFVSATNHGFSAREYLADFPLSHVGEIHLAGHAEQADDEGYPLLIDSHDGPVANAVWKLYEIVIAQCGPIPTLVEWDSNIPDWPILKAEAAAAQAILDRWHTIVEDRHAAA